MAILVSNRSRKNDAALRFCLMKSTVCTWINYLVLSSILISILISIKMFWTDVEQGWGGEGEEKEKEED